MPRLPRIVPRLLAGLSGLVAIAPGGLSGGASVHAGEDGLRAGAARIDISPEGYPVIVNAMFTERSADRVVDPLEVCALVLDDGNVRVAIAVVDSCMVPRDILDAAKEIASRETGIPVGRMLVSSTHTHSAPSAMGCLGSRVDPEYAALLPGRIARAIADAALRLEPARAGWVQVDDWDHTFNRRWIRRPDRLLSDPFGRPTVRAHMHPGHESRDVTGPSGPVDPGLTVLSIEAVDGRPLGLLANYSQHYYGSPLLSSDYYGRFRRYLVEAMGGDERAPGFVPIMCQGTSGDLMWMDYSGPSRDIGYDAYAREMAERVMAGIEGLAFSERVPLAMAERTLDLGFRLPGEDRLGWARAMRDRLGDRLPKSLEEIYALEALHLETMRRAEIKLQAMRVGDLGITAIPNEVFALTGLKLKAQSPLPVTMNVSLANGASGYIPPPEQHALGGYTTWPARTAGLEIEAEPRIVETLLDLLEEVAGGRTRRNMEPAPGPAARAVMDSEPLAYWRLDDAVIPAALDASGNGRHGRFEGGIALYLSGVGSGNGLAPDHELVPSPFAADGGINRAIHLAGGHLAAGIPLPAAGDFTVAFWFWNGLPADARDVTGILVSRIPAGSGGGVGEVLGIGGVSGPTGRLFLCGGGNDEPVAVGGTGIRFREWHHVALIRRGDRVSVHLDGAGQPELWADLPVAAPGPGDGPGGSGASAFLIGGQPGERDSFEGRIDEAAVFGRALPESEIAAHFAASGVAEQRARLAAERERAMRSEAERARVPQLPPAFRDAVLALQPSVFWMMDESPTGGDSWLADASGNNVRGIVEAGALVPGLGAARHSGGRIGSVAAGVGPDYTVAFWFRNDLPNNVRPVTAYLFSRGRDGADGAPGDHLGIGGTYRPDLTGRLIVFNGNSRDEVVAGRSEIRPGAWNFVVLARQGRRVSVFLNGAAEAEIDADLEPTFPAGDGAFFLGGRNDRFAPLDGWIGPAALFPRALSAEEAGRLHAAAGDAVGSVDADPGRDTAVGEPHSPPLDPEESLAGIHVRDGYRIELAASEPLVVDPVAFDWDGEGRLWVVEMADYPLGIDGAGTPGGRIRVLEDSDDDGRYDRSWVFAEGLNFPNGILAWRDGVLVTAAPDILFLRDADGDGMADEREVLYSGFLEGNQQLRVNGLRWGLDNWIYCGAGGHHGGHGAGTRVVSRRTGEVVAIGSRDCRIRPDTGEIEPASGPTQFGRNRDPWGRWFGTQNSWPLWHYVLPDRYLRRNPHVPAPSPMVQLVVPMNPPIFPASRPEKRYHSFGESGHFTSACSGMIYSDQVLFGAGDAEQHAFTCEPFHNLVHHAVVRDAGATFTAERADEERQSEFIAGEDRWFRPVMTRTGPDGALWVADMYRYMIEHPEWLPADGKEELLPHYRKGDDRGRIYRVVPAGAETGRVPKLGRLSNTELAGEFRHPNAWRRDKAQMLLLWRNDPSIVPVLRELAETGADPHARLHAICTLDGLGALDAARVRRALEDPHPAVRENALRLAEQLDDPGVVASAAALAGDTNAKVRLQLAFSLGEWDGAEAGEALGRLAIESGDDPHLLAATMSSAIRHPAAVTRAAVRADDTAFARLAEPLVQLTAASGEPDALRSLVTRVFSRLNADADDGFDDAEAVGLAVRIVDLLAARGLGLADVVGDATALRIAGVVIEKIGDASRAPESLLRIGLLAARLPGARSEAVAAASNSWLDARQPPEIQRGAVEVVAASGIDGVPELLLGRWDSLGPVGRKAVIDVLLTRDDWALDLLRRAGGDDAAGLGPGAFDPALRSRLVGHGTPEIREAAEVLFRDAAAGTRAEVVDRFRPALETAGDPARGAAVHARLCAVCHRRGNAEGGVAIGPDLISVREHAPEKLLVNILDPNASVEPGYHGYHCTLASGEQLYGLIASETANSVNLKLADGRLRAISRADIRALRSSNLSLMPEGLEAGMSIDDLADLLAYLRSAE